MDDKDYAVELLDLVSSLPENIGVSEYECPLITDSNGNLQIGPSLQKRLDEPANAHLKAWATIERIQKLF